MHLHLGRLDPQSISLELQPRFAFFAGLEWEELPGNFQHAVLMRVNCKRHHLIARDIKIWHGGFTTALERHTHIGRTLPPIAGGQRFQPCKFVTKRLKGIFCVEKVSGDHQRPRAGGSQF